MARPNLSYLKNLFLAVAGIPCGFVTGLMGLGNWVILLPLLRWLIALRGQALSGTTLTVMFFSALTGLLAYGQNHFVRWDMGVALILGYVPGAIVGGRLAPAGRPKAPAARLRPMWAVLTIALGFFMLIDGLGHGPKALDIYPGLKGMPDALIYVVVLVVGLAVGLVSRAADLGGVLMVPALIYLLREQPRMAQGTALFVLLIASLPGALRYGAARQLDPRAAVWVSFGAVLGALAGSRAAMALRAADTALVFLYGIALAIVGLAMIASTARAQDD